MIKNLGIYIFISILFVIVSIVYFKPLPEKYVTWIVIGLIFLSAAILFIFRKGVLPSILITKYLPLPLILLSPQLTELKDLFRKRILPAIQVLIELTETESPEKAYTIIKHVREFFSKELEGVNLGSTEAIRKKLAANRLYSDIDDENERKNFQYSLASLIHWIARYRNLAMHSYKVSADPIDSWFALRTALIYIRDKYPLKEASLYTKCPKCKAVNRIKLYDGKIRWLQEIMVQCKECKNNYKVKITPKLITEHYQIMSSLN